MGRKSCLYTTVYRSIVYWRFFQPILRCYLYTLYTTYSTLVNLRNYSQSLLQCKWLWPVHTVNSMDIGTVHFHRILHFHLEFCNFLMIISFCHNYSLHVTHLRYGTCGKKKPEICIFLYLCSTYDWNCGLHMKRYIFIFKRDYLTRANRGQKLVYHSSALVNGPL